MKYQLALISLVPVLLAALVAVRMLPAGATGAPPNDDRTDAILIDALPFNAAVTNVGATTEPGENLPCGMAATIWYRFEAPATGRVSISLNESDYDTGVAVYTEAGTDDIVCNDDYYGLRSHVAFDASNGTTYYIQFGGYNSRTGNLAIRMDFTENFPGISGAITEEGSGMPVPRACLRLYTAGSSNSMGNATADDSGNYTLEGLVPGSYNMFIRDCNANLRAAEYYGGAIVRAQAQEIVVGAEDHLTLDESLLVGGTLAGRVRDGLTHASVQSACIYAYDPDGNNAGYAYSQADGTYMMTGLNNDYTVQFVDCRSDPILVSQYYPGVRTQDEAQTVNVGAGAAVTDIDIDLPRGGSIEGKVRNAADSSGIGDACVTAYLMVGDELDYADGTSTDDNGNFELNTLPPGDYKFYTYWCGSGRPQTATTWFGGFPTSENAKVLTVPAGQTLTGRNIDVVVFAQFGDGDCNGLANVADAITVLSDQVGLPPGPCLQNTDINCDGNTDLDDVAAYLKGASGLPFEVEGDCPAIGPFPGEEP